MSDFFKLEKNKTTIGREMLAGCTTFLAMAYILAVNPNILGNANGMPRGGIFVATAIASFIGTCCMAFFANYPFALAPGMGLNAYFTYTVCQGMGYSWQIALLAVFAEGIIFLLLSLTPIRQALFNSIPLPLKSAVSVGIGLFIAFIALQSAHVIVDNSSTLLSFQDFSKSNITNHGICAILAIIGTIATAWMLHKKIRGAILLGILITWILGIFCEITDVYQVNADDSVKCYSLIPKLSFDTFSQSIKDFGNLFCSCFDVKNWTLTKEIAKVGADGAQVLAADGAPVKETIITQGWPLLKSLNFVVVIFAFMFVDIFDTLGTLIGVSTKANMLDKDGKLPRIKGALLSDSLATSAGAILGTSTVTTFVESASGVAEGGRTGLTALTTAFLFLISIVLAPVFLAIPGFATAPALIIVGFYMFSGVVHIDFNDYLNSIPCYLTILIMPLAYSISDGICAGIVSWTVLNLCSPRYRTVSPVMIILTLLFVAKYMLL